MPLEANAEQPTLNNRSIVLSTQSERGEVGWEARKGIELPTASREPEGLARLAVSHFTTGHNENDGTLRRRYRMPNLVHSQRGNMKAVPLPKRRSAEVPRRRMHLISARFWFNVQSRSVCRGRWMGLLRFNWPVPISPDRISGRSILLYEGHPPRRPRSCPRVL